MRAAGWSRRTWWPDGLYPPSSVEIRPATLADAPAIMAIYNREVTGSTVTFDLVPRTLADQEAWLTARSGAHTVLVGLKGDAHVGFASLSPFRDRPAYNSTVESSIYLAPEFQGQGLGKQLLGALVDTAAAHGFHTMIARIVGHHEGSIALHRSLGYTEVGTEREVGRKFGRWLDVVVMQRML